MLSAASECSIKRASGPGRGGGAAPGGGGARSPQTARGRGRPGRAPAGAAGGGCAAQGEGPGSGRRPCPPLAAPRPQALEPQSALSIPLSRTLSRARTGLNSGPGLQVGIFPAKKSLCVDRTATLDGWPPQSCASAWALPLRQLHCLRWPEGAVCHGGSHLPRGSHRHRLQWPRRLLAATALGHSLLGLPFSIC